MGNATPMNTLTFFPFNYKLYLFVHIEAFSLLATNRAHFMFPKKEFLLDIFQKPHFQQLYSKQSVPNLRLKLNSH